jgi:hypothetical protein
MQSGRDAGMVPEPLPPRVETKIVILKEKEPLFTGKRRARIKKICPCCGEKFTTTNPEKVYKNQAHKQRVYDRNLTTRAGRKPKKQV